jgi:hypothetical protein
VEWLIGFVADLLRMLFYEDRRVVWIRLGTDIVRFLFWRESATLESVRVEELLGTAVSSLASNALDWSTVNVHAKFAVWLGIGTLLADLLSVVLNADLALLVVLTGVRKWELWRDTVAQLVQNVIRIFANTETILHLLVNLAGKGRIWENRVFWVLRIFGRLWGLDWRSGEVWAGLSEAGFPLGKGSFHASLFQFEVSVGYGSW